MNFHNFAKKQIAPRRRSTFGLPFEHKFTGNSGALLPFYCCEVLPGDTFNVSTNYVARLLQTPARPVMDNMYMDVWYFYVPSRILWKNWEKFCGVAEPSEYSSPTSYVLPVVNFSSNPIQAGSVGNLLGLPIGFAGSCNALVLSGYYKIWNDWFRDQNLQSTDTTPETIYSAASGATLSGGYAKFFELAGKYPITSVSKYHDVFTSALPSPQKGPAVTLPLGTVAPVIGSGTTLDDTHAMGTVVLGYDNDGDPGAFVGNAPVYSSNGVGSLGSSTETNTTVGIKYTNLVADLSNATSATIDELRNSIALQRYYEGLALGGSRYVELLRNMFGVAPTDARLARPEYLGGSHQRLNMQQVATTAGTGTVGTSSATSTGALGAYSVTSSSQGSFIKSFDEFGYVYGLCAVRVKHSYSQGLPKKFLKKDRFDYYWPQFDRLGEVPVDRNEIYYDGTDNTFGFQEAWYEYRHTPDRVSGSITPGYSTDLTAWTYGDVYSTAPTLSDSWITEDKGRIQQTLAGTSTVPQFIFDFFVDNKATRPMSLNSVPSSLGM